MYSRNNSHNNRTINLREQVLTSTTSTQSNPNITKLSDTSLTTQDQQKKISIHRRQYLK